MISIQKHGQWSTAPVRLPVDFGHRISDLCARHRATLVLACNAAVTPPQIAGLQPVLLW